MQVSMEHDAALAQVFLNKEKVDVPKEKVDAPKEKVGAPKQPPAVKPGYQDFYLVGRLLLEYCHP